METITAILIAFVLVCCAWPGLVRRRQPFVLALAAAMGALVLMVLSTVSLYSHGVQLAAGIIMLIGILDAAIFLLLVLACTGLTFPEILSELGGAFRALRGGGPPGFPVIPPVPPQQKQQ